MTLDAMQTDLYLSGAATAGGGDDGPPEAQVLRPRARGLCDSLVIVHIDIPSLRQSGTSF